MSRIEHKPLVDSEELPLPQKQSPDLTSPELDVIDLNEDELLEDLEEQSKLFSIWNRKTMRLEAIVVAVLTMVSSTVYTVKMYNWWHDKMELYIYASELEAWRMRRLCQTLVWFSVIGNIMVFVSSIPVLFAALPKSLMERCQRRHHLLPFIFVQIFTMITAINRLMLTFIFSESATNDSNLDFAKLYEIRSLDIVTSALALFLICAFYRDLKKSKGRVEDIEASPVTIRTVKVLGTSTNAVERKTIPFCVNGAM
uniref:Transmembrane protein n=2 Tax=Clytia hemisphaerica TaxID=252671 RepID=A0A7M5V964_9CNID